jgi:ATP-dependent exoDNAse (exonuclease V) beta subunit
VSAPTADAAARQRLKTDLDTTFVVEAAAGTGKTTVLVDRVVALVKSGRAQLSRIIAVTFTEKAAGEMKLRLRSRLEEARTGAGASPEERARLDASLEELEAARIGTIHSLCADLLRERPVEAAVDPLFQVAANDEAAQLLEEAFSGWFQRVLPTPGPGVRRLLRRTPARRNGHTPRRLLRDAALRLVEHRDFDAPWRRDESFQRDLEIDAAVAKLRELGALAPRSKRDDNLRKALAEVRRFIEDLDHKESVAPRDHDGLEAALRDLSRKKFWSWNGYGSDFADGLPRSQVLKMRDEAKDALTRLVERSDADLAAHLREELLPVVAAYEAQKSSAGKLDFTDLLIKTRDLLRDQRAVREELQGRFSHLFVDEFQDTDPLQAEILLLLSADDPEVSEMDRARPVPGKLFIVGDPKQSIYSFRRADVALYQRIKARLLEAGAVLLYLSRSFRSVDAIQSAVNAAFAPAMGDGTATQARYVPLEPGRGGAPPDRPAVVVLPVPRPYGEFGTIVEFKIEDSFPDAVAAFVEYLVRGSGWTVEEEGLDRRRHQVPIQPRHICLLFRRFQSYGDDLTRGYAAALEVRRIPHVLVGGRSFHAREEVLALRNALTAVEWPEDELAVFAALRGPLFALSDDQLLAFRAAAGRMHPFRPLDLEALSPAAREVAQALKTLGRLHRRRNRRPIAGTVSELLAATRAHAGLAFWSGGEQALANVLHLADLGRRFESRGVTSFRAFVEQLWDEAAEGEAEEARVVEEGTEGVRLMTVHRAKGLEFPVVILADPTAKAVSQNPSRHVDTARRLWAEPLADCVPWDLLDHREEALRRDREESLRLTYVASTRARDLLVLPGVGDFYERKREGWLDVLLPVMSPRDGTERSPAAPAGCPQFGKDTVVDRPDGARYDPARTVMPGEHQPRAGTHRVTWWDPSALQLGKETDVAMRRQEILAEDPGGENARQSLQANQAWEADRAALLAQGRAPSVEVRAVRMVPADESAGETFPVEISGAARDGRPGGTRFGALVHGIISRAPLDADRPRLEALARFFGRILGSPEAERAAAVEAALAALEHPVMVRARGALEVRRECPVALRTGEREVAEGAVDLAFREADGWTVVELKTDAPDSVSAAYHRQLGLYVRAVAEATGMAAHGVILLV